MADRGYNYILQIQNRLRLVPGFEDDPKMWIWIFELYRDLRVDGYFNNENPRSVAGGVVYCGAVKFGHPCILQRDIAIIINMTEVTVRKNYKKIKIFLTGKENAGLS